MREAAPNWDRVQGNGRRVKSGLKAQWDKLTDDELDAIAGRREERSGKIQERHGIA